MYITALLLKFKQTTWQSQSKARTDTFSLNIPLYLLLKTLQLHATGKKASNAHLLMYTSVRCKRTAVSYHNDQCRLQVKWTPTLQNTHWSLLKGGNQQEIEKLSTLVQLALDHYYTCRTVYLSACLSFWSLKVNLMSVSNTKKSSCSCGTCFFFSCTM